MMPPPVMLAMPETLIFFFTTSFTREVYRWVGFNNVFNLDGGFLKWLECGFDINE